MPQDRFSPYMDQGERDYEFYLDASDTKTRLELIEREAAVCNEKPMALSFFPSGQGKKIKPFAILSDDVITMPVFKRSEDKKNYIIRLFNPTDKKRVTTLKLPMLRWENEFELDAYQLKSYKLDVSTKRVVETDLVERNK